MIVWELELFNCISKLFSSKEKVLHYLDNPKMYYVNEFLENTAPISCPDTDETIGWIRQRQVL